VTGASKGIGAAIAKALAQDGWHVAVNYRADDVGAKATVAAIEGAVVMCRAQRDMKPLEDVSAELETMIENAIAA
jgi:3-oxoacyl-[acyl-carrier protein] reductase